MILHQALQSHPEIQFSCQSELRILLHTVISLVKADLETDSDGKLMNCARREDEEMSPYFISSPCK